MVKRWTEYSAMAQRIDSIKTGGWLTNIKATTKKGFDRKINKYVPIDCHQIINWRESWFRSNGKLTCPDRVLKRSLLRFEFTDNRVANLANARSIRKLWHRWNYLIRSIIPTGFQVLANKYEAMPTALSIRQRLKALIPTAYNCYLLDRDIRRYLGLALRHA
jgi:hypothetical protein